MKPFNVNMSSEIVIDEEKTAADPGGKWAHNKFSGRATVHVLGHDGSIIYQETFNTREEAQAAYKCAVAIQKANE